jgi:hypothetical protein
MLTLCATPLLYGKIYAFYSLKWVYITAVTIFEIGSLICGAGTKTHSRPYTTSTTLTPKSSNVNCAHHRKGNRGSWCSRHFHGRRADHCGYSAFA